MGVAKEQWRTTELSTRAAHPHWCWTGLRICKCSGVVWCSLHMRRDSLVHCLGVIASSAQVSWGNRRVFCMYQSVYSCNTWTHSCKQLVQLCVILSMRCWYCRSKRGAECSSRYFVRRRRRRRGAGAAACTKPVMYDWT